MKKPIVLVVLGPQGSGKSTQVERLAEKLNLKIFEAGSALRFQAKDNLEIRQQLSQGILVEDETMRSIIVEFIETNPSEGGYIFDGYPRDIGQFQGFTSLVRKYDWVTAGIFINLSDTSAKKRLANRYQLIEGKKVRRLDDKPEIVQKRLDTFKRETLPLKNLFQEKFNLLEIDGEPPVDGVTSQISSVVDNFLDVLD